MKVDGFSTLAILVTMLLMLCYSEGRGQGNNKKKRENMILVVFLLKGGWQVIGYIIVFMIFEACPFYLLGIFGAMVTAMVGILIYGLVYMIKRKILEKRGQKVPIQI